MFLRLFFISEYDILAIPEVHGKQTAYRFVLSKFMNDQSLQHVTSTVLPKELNTKRKTPSKTTPTKQVIVDESSQLEAAQAPTEGDVFATRRRLPKKEKLRPLKITPILRVHLRLLPKVPTRIHKARQMVRSKR